MKLPPLANFNESLNAVQSVSRWVHLMSHHADEDSFELVQWWVRHMLVDQLAAIRSFQ